MPKVVILGAGSIGLSFAAVFADAGASVTLAEPDADRRATAAAGIAAQRRAMELAGLCRGCEGELRLLPDGGPALPDADLVIEAGPERLEAKQAIFAGLLAGAAAQAVLATASSAIPISRILPDHADQARALVAHPANPPAVLRVIELVPGPGTAAATLDRAQRIFAGVGFHPVTLGHEIEGFVMNRLQGAVLREAYRLVDEGVADVAGIDAVMRLSLGPRWALSGPFETAELNTPGGIRAHAARMGPAYRAMGEARGERGCDWGEELVGRVEAERRAMVAADDLPGRAVWRARSVAQLVALRDALMDTADDAE